MKKDDSVYIREILELTDLIESSTIGKSETDLIDDDLNLRDASIRRIEVIGEAIKNISDKTKREYPKIEWKKISGTRDNVIHHYFNVDIKIIWSIIKNDIPLLKKQMNEILNDIEKNNDGDKKS